MLRFTKPQGFSVLLASLSLYKYIEGRRERDQKPHIYIMCGLFLYSVLLCGVIIEGVKLARWFQRSSWYLINLVLYFWLFSIKAIFYDAFGMISKYLNFLSFLIKFMQYCFAKQLITKSIYLYIYIYMDFFC